MERSSSQSAEAVNFSVPERLTPGQNFFDQFPFADIVQAYAGTLPEDPLNIPFTRTLVSALGKHHRIPKISHIAEGQAGTLRKSPLPHFIPSQGRLHALITHMEKIDGELAEFPDWKEYVNVECTNYRPDGAISKSAQNAKSIIYPVTYSYWILNRARRKLILAGDSTPHTSGDEATVIERYKALLHQVIPAK